MTGIDLAAPMLAHARDRAHRAGAANVTFRDGDAEDPGSYPGWEPGSFDVILASNVLQFLLRPAEAARHWRALLTPQGTVGITWSLAQDPRWAPVLRLRQRHHHNPRAHDDLPKPPAMVGHLPDAGPLGSFLAAHPAQPAPGRTP